MAHTMRERPIKLDLPLQVFWNDTDELDSKTICTGTEEATYVEEVHIPKTQLLQNYEAETNTDFAIPLDYINYQEKDNLEMHGIIEYDLDEDDEAFLETFQGKEYPSKKENTDPFSMDAYFLEAVLDFLEKESFDQKEYAQVSLPEPDDCEMSASETTMIDDDLPCCVCGSEDYDDTNLIVFCDGCNVAIHQECQGLSEVPQDDWYCDRCLYLRKKKLSTDTEVFCCQCQQTGGAMKRTSDGTWIHIICALWIPELTFDSTYNTVDISKENRKRSKLICESCQLGGGCIQCSTKTCMTAYHPTCAQLNIQYMKEEETKQGIFYVSYCKKHTEAKKQREIVKKIDSRETKVQLGLFIDRYTRKDFQKKLKKKIPEKVFTKIVEYWKQKRYALRNGREPLIRRLLIETEDEQARQELIEPRKHAVQHRSGTTQEKYQQLKELRQGLEQSRVILDMIKKRERIKLEMTKSYLASCQPLYLEITLPPNFVESHPELFPMTASQKRKRETIGEVTKQPFKKKKVS